MQLDPTGSTLFKSQLGSICHNVLLAFELGSKLCSDAGQLQAVYDSLVGLFGKLEAVHSFQILTSSEKNDFMGHRLILEWVSRIAVCFSRLPVQLRGDSIFATIFRFFLENYVKHHFDGMTSAPLQERSLFGNARFTSLFPCHLLCFALVNAQSAAKEYIESYLQNSLSLDEFCIYLSVLPLRWLAISHLASAKAIPVASRGIRHLAKSFMSGSSLLSFVQICALVQRSLGWMTDKDAFVDEMAHLYGMFDARADRSDYQKQQFCFYFSLACLLTDEACVKSDFGQLGKRTLECVLFPKAIAIDAILEAAPLAPVAENLTEIADSVSTPRANLWKLKNDRNCHPFVISLNVALAMNHLSHYRQRFPDVLSPFPPLRPNTEDCTYDDVLSSPTLLSLMFLTLIAFADIDGLKSWETIHIVFNFLLILASRNEGHTKLDLPEVEIPSSAILRSRFARWSFAEQMWTRIKIADCDRPARSMVDLMESCGPLGVSTLIAMNIGFVSVVSEKVANPRDRARLFRERISQEFSDRQASFGDLSELDLDEEGCNVCNLPADPDETLCFPAVAYLSPFSRTADPVYCFRLCAHLVHERCIHMSEAGNFRCPVDRLARTILIPNMAKIGYAKPSRSVMILLRNFRVAVETVTHAIYDVEMVISSLCHSLTIQEIRMRSCPSCSESKLFRNLFLILWHLHHSFALSFSRDDSDPLRALVGAVIESSDPIGICDTEAGRLAFGIAAPDQFVFLRQASLFRHFCLDHDRENVDLSAEAVSQHFGRKVNPGLPSTNFGFVDLPHRFIDLSEPPFSLDIENQSTERVLCLLTGTVVSMERVEGTYTHLSKHLQRKCPSHATFLLALGGPCATRLSVASTQMNSIKVVTGIYLDANGDEDVGFRRGKVTYLNEARRAKYADMLFSGEWTDFDTSG
jgi:hypothetical protein